MEAKTVERFSRLRGSSRALRAGELPPSAVLARTPLGDAPWTPLGQCTGSGSARRSEPSLRLPLPKRAPPRLHDAVRLARNMPNRLAAGCTLEPNSRCFGRGWTVRGPECGFSSAKSFEGALTGPRQSCAAPAAPICQRRCRLESGEPCIAPICEPDRPSARRSGVFGVLRPGCSSVTLTATPLASTRGPCSSSLLSGVVASSCCGLRGGGAARRRGIRPDRFEEPGAWALLCG